MKNLCWIVVWGCWLFTSCITNRDTVLLQKSDKKSLYAPIDYTYYKLQPNDWIVYSVYSTDIETARLFSGAVSSQGTQNGISQGYRIYPDGNVVMPFLGKIRLNNLTLKEAESVLRAKIRESLPDAEVKLALASEYYYVVGYGRYELEKERVTILEALAPIASKDKLLNKKKIRLLRREDNGAYSIKTIDLRAESLIGSEYYYVKPNDVYYIPTSNKAFYNITSFSGFLSFVMVPVSFLLLILNL